MNLLLLLLIIPGALWWLFVALFGWGWVLAARNRRRKQLEATAKAVLTPDADIDIPLDDTPSARELQQWFALPSHNKEH